MKRFRILMASAVALLLVAAVGTSVNGSGLVVTGEYVPDRVLVKFADGTKADAIAKALAQYGLSQKPVLGPEWGPYQTYADLAWDVTRGSSGVTIAIVDYRYRPQPPGPGQQGADRRLQLRQQHHQPAG